MTWDECAAHLAANCDPSPGPFPASSLLYAHKLWLLSECIGAKTVLEIGIGPTSVSGNTFILSMANRGGGTLWSLDIDPDRPRSQDRTLAMDKNVAWHQRYGDSLTLAGTVPVGLQVDLLYVDGDHDYAHAYGDTKAYLPFLRTGGYLVIDDYPNYAGVVAAARQLESEGFVFVHLPHVPPHGDGCLVWQKQAMA